MHGKNSKMLEKYCKVDRKCEKKVKSCSKKKREKILAQKKYKNKKHVSKPRNSSKYLFS